VRLLSFIAKRTAVSALQLVLLSVATFAIYFAVPVDSATILVGLSTQRATQEERDRANRALGTDRPVVVQYADWASGLVRGDFGISWLSAEVTLEGELVGVPVRDVLFDAAKVTGSLALGGAVVIVLLAVPLGMLAATRPRGMLDRTVLLVSLIAISTHPLVVAVLLRAVGAEQLGIAPPFGYCPLFEPTIRPESDETVLAPLQQQTCGGLVDWAHHLLLPWIAFALFLLALYVRMLRARTLEVLSEDYIRTARAKGLPEWRVVTRHAARNAIAPVVTMLAMDIGMAVGVAIYLETVFRLPGLGRLALAALAGEVGYDLPMILGVVVFTGIVIIVLNLVADLVVALLDPRVREAGSRRVAVSGLRAA
jgi:peptide/nickel transport system permease protein